MSITVITTILVLASCYTVYHSFLAFREHRDNSSRRKLGVPFKTTDTRNETGRATAKTAPEDFSQFANNLVTPIETANVEAVASLKHTSTKEDVSPLYCSQNRSLFSNKAGIVNEMDDGAALLPPPRPEDLPIPEDDLVFGPATAAIAQLLPESDRRREEQQKNLVAAGYYSRAAWLNLNAIRFVLAFLVLLVVGFWLLTAPPQLEPVLLGLVVLGPLLMWALPPLIVASRASERRVNIERGLPDVLDMLNMGVSQGLTVPASLKRIGPEITNVHSALAQELKIVNQQANVSSLSDALRSFSKRVDSPEVSSFTSLLLQSEATGTSISQALSDYSDSMRSSLRERADSRANAASFKLLFPTAMCLMPSVFLFLLGPAIVEMTNFFENTAGSILSTRSQAIESLEQRPVVVPLDN